MKHLDRRQIAGWLAVGSSIIITCFWAAWGIIENFHEGWYYGAILPNLGLMFVQYLGPMLAFLMVTLIAIYRPGVGGALYVILTLLAAWFFNALSNPGVFILILPLIGIGALYWFGRPQPRRLAASLALGLPLLTLLVFGIEPILRVSQRFDDGNLMARLVQGNSVALVWAPDGPGWPHAGTDWYEAQQMCQHLSEDGRTRVPTPQRIWRLPTVDEAVRSMACHGRNCGGVWQAETAEATYLTRPDKESPLWNVHSRVIYWWTATVVNEEEAYIIVYDGQVWPRAKHLRQGYLGFRCVREPNS
jgi:hypothetical protein